MYCSQMTEPNLGYMHVTYRNFPHILRLLNVCNVCLFIASIIGRLVVVHSISFQGNVTSYTPFDKIVQ